MGQVLLAEMEVFKWYVSVLGQIHLPSVIVWKFIRKTAQQGFKSSFR